MKITTTFLFFTILLISCKTTDYQNNKDQKKDKKTLTNSENVSTEEHYENGKLKKTGYYNSEGQQEGEWKEYYKNGSIKEIYFFKNGNLTQEWKEYYENENIKKLRNITSGEWKEYYENGNIKNDGNFPLTGLPTGKWNYYHINGELYQTQLLSNGKRIEILTCLDGKGNKLDKGTLKNGNGTIRKYDIDGNLIKITQFKDGLAVEN